MLKSALRGLVAAVQLVAVGASQHQAVALQHPGSALWAANFAGHKQPVCLAVDLPELTALN